MNEKKNTINIDESLIKNIKDIIVTSRSTVASTVNHTLIKTYWLIGKEVVTNESKNNINNQSSRQIILLLSKRITEELGRGFSRSDLFNMRKFYIAYPDVQTLSGQLSWSHICELLSIEDKEKLIAEIEMILQE